MEVGGRQRGRLGVGSTKCALAAGASAMQALAAGRQRGNSIFLVAFSRG